MNFPDGEHLIEGKIYVVKDGEVVEIKEVEKEEVEMAAEEVVEETTEEVAMEDTSVTEEEVVEEEMAQPAKMAIDPVTDGEAILAIVTPFFEEREKALIAMIADLKNQLEEIGVAKEEKEDETEVEVKLSAFDLFKAFRASNK